MTNYPWVVMPNDIQALARAYLGRELTPDEEAYAERFLCEMLEDTLADFGRYLPTLVEEMADTQNRNLTDT